MQARVLQRTRDIYLVHLLLLALGILGATALQQISFQGIHPFQAFLAGALLLYQPGYCDILPMYCVFLLFTPLVLDQMMKGRYTCLDHGSQWRCSGSPDRIGRLQMPS